MADAVTSQTIFSSRNQTVMKFTNISDGTGESAVLKVDVSALYASLGAVAIEKIVFSTAGMGVDILWDATTPVIAWHVPLDQSGVLDFGPNGLLNPKATGWTGDLKFTTVGHSSGDRYSIALYMRGHD